MNEQDVKIIQGVLNYYRNKCYKLEYDFLLYKEYAENKIKELSAQQDNRTNVKDSSDSIGE